MRSSRHAVAFAISAIVHVLLAMGINLSTASGRAPRRPQTIAVFAASRENPQFPGLQPFDSSPHETAHAGEDAFSLGGLHIDLKKISARIGVLFPALTPGLAIDGFFPDPDMLIAPRQAIASANRSGAGAAPPLVLSEREVQSIVDRAWARRDRWQAFHTIVTLMDGHSAAGSLPRLLRAYRVEDGLQPYEDRETRDPRLWVQLSLAADHASFIAVIRTYAAAHPSTPAATELLLLLDTIVQGEQDVLHVLLDTDPAADLQLTRDASPQAGALIVQIRNEYREELKARRLTSPTAIDAYYDNVRVAILRRVIESAADGYGVDEARFLRGAILWRTGRRSEARETWRRLSAHADGSYAPACAALRAALSRPQVDDREIQHILNNEDDRRLSAAYDRLRQFGYRMDSY